MFKYNLLIYICKYINVYKNDAEVVHILSPRPQLIKINVTADIGYDIVWVAMATVTDKVKVHFFYTFLHCFGVTFLFNRKLRQLLFASRYPPCQPYPFAFNFFSFLLLLLLLLFEPL